MITGNDDGRGDKGACDGDEVIMEVMVLVMMVMVGDGGEDISYLFLNMHQ